MFVKGSGSVHNNLAPVCKEFNDCLCSECFLLLLEKSNYNEVA